MADQEMTRGKALLMVLLGAGCIAGNHWLATSEGKVYFWLVFMGPLILLLGIGGLFDPRISQSIGPRGKYFPVHTKVIGGVLALCGMLISAYLALGVYRLQDGGTPSRYERSTSDSAP